MLIQEDSVVKTSTQSFQIVPHADAPVSASIEDVQKKIIFRSHGAIRMVTVREEGTVRVRVHSENAAQLGSIESMLKGSGFGLEPVNV